MAPNHHQDPTDLRQQGQQNEAEHREVLRRRSQHAGGAPRDQLDRRVGLGVGRLPNGPDCRIENLTPVEPTIVSDVVIATAFGFAVAFAIYWWFSKSRGALRFIDLVSFAIGFLAICAGLFAVYNYRGDSEKNNHRWTFKLDLSEASLDTQFDMMTRCERTRLPSRSTIRR
jgi:hypothetical protein